MTTKSKAYSSASNAKRAAKAAGLALDGFDITSDVNGHYYTPRKSTPAPAAKKAAEPATKKAAPVVKTPEPAKPAAPVVAPTVSEQHTAALENGTLVGGNGEAAVPLVRKSTIQNPVEWVWGYFDKQKAKADKKGEKISRKGAIAGAVASGIAFYTARTQYQSWKTANKF